MHHLFEIFYAFGNHVHAHVPCEIDQRFYDGGGVAVGTDGIHEYLVDLDDINTEFQHVGKSAVAGADVVDGNAHAKPLQCGNDLPGFSEVLDRIALGHFQHDLRE